MARVMVYLFRKKHDVVRDEGIVSEHYATLEAIARCRGEAIMNTALELEETQLDAKGFVARDAESTDSTNGLSMRAIQARRSAGRLMAG
jgi:hypothetical protein